MCVSSLQRIPPTFCLGPSRSMHCGADYPNKNVRALSGQTEGDGCASRSNSPNKASSLRAPGGKSKAPYTPEPDVLFDIWGQVALQSLLATPAPVAGDGFGKGGYDPCLHVSA